MSSFKFVEYALEDDGRELVGNGSFFRLKPGIKYPVVEDASDNLFNSIFRPFADRLVEDGIVRAIEEVRPTPVQVPIKQTPPEA